MKVIKPQDCGLCEWAATAAANNKGLSVARISKYWIKRLPKALTEQAVFASGLKMKFYTDSSRIIMKYHICTDSSENKAFSVVVNQKTYRYDNICYKDCSAIKIECCNNSVKLLEILFPWDGDIILYGIEVDKTAKLLPYYDTRKKLCFYGDSITHGANASEPVRTYPYIVGKKVDMQIINHGYRGAAFPDPAVAIFLGMEVDWDILCIAIGTNTYGQDYESAIEFAKLYRVFLDIVRLHRPEAPVVCITPIWRGDSDGNHKFNRRDCSLQDYRDAIKNIVLELNPVDRNLYLIDGLTLICDRNGLSTDLIHPDDYGMEILANGVSLLINGIKNNVKVY